ncbi:PREDICTED: PRAME family member 12-like [Propithecus coquereli]|nr:PREDICTED: PRAME family member 12-like [Propithecus coquereli]
MSVQDPPRLLQLAGQSLLRDEAVAIPALEELPTELFPPLFMEAFTKSRSKTLMAMVQAWPFTRLPLGALMLTPDLETLRTVLEGLDVLLAQKVRPSGWKLQVLDLREVDENFWSMWSGAPVRSPRATSQRQTGEDCPGMGRQWPLKVVVDLLCFHDSDLHEFLTHVFEWALQRKDLVHLCCKRVVLCGKQIYGVKKFLEMVELKCIQDVKMRNFWGLYQLGWFVPYLAQMKSLRKLHLTYILERNYTWLERVGQTVARFTSTFLKLDNLHKLHLYRVPFLKDHLDQLVRCLKTPLESFAITECCLSELEMERLFLCPSTHQLKELDLTGIKLSSFNPEPLQILLENIAATLQVLILEDCWITDYQLSVILPALSRCHQLMTLNFSGNQISKAILENLLGHTVGLSRLSLEIYPVPRECYDDGFKDINQKRFLQLQAGLMEILRDLRQPKRMEFRTLPCS